ncbi:MAG: creatininase family protein, partial [Ruthenibacterium sp.]
MILNELNQEDAAQAMAQDVVALLPIGATEVHGNHLPLGTDTFLAQGVVEKVAEKLGAQRVLVLPAVP